MTIIAILFAVLLALPAQIFAQAQSTTSPATVSIVGTSGPGAYTPNPVSVGAGGAVVFKNNDSRTHHIVLDDGSGDVGNLQPGATSRAVTVSSGAPVNFHCTIHPSMVGSINGSAPPAASSAQSAGAYGYGETPDTGAQPEFPGIPPSQNKIEAQAGTYLLRVYGTLLLNTSVSTGGLVGQDVPLWTSPVGGNVTFPDGTVGHSSDSHDLIFTARQSIIGMTFNPASPGTGWSTSGRFEFDFFGPRPVDTFDPQNRAFNTPRLRVAYFQLEHKRTRIVFGQDKMILAPLDPISLSHVALPLGATAGDLWAWLPQVRVDVRPSIFVLQAGVLRPQFGDSRLETPPAASTSLDTGASGLGERSTMPFFQGRVAIEPHMFGSKASIGIAGHTGRERIGVDRTLPSKAVALDASVPVTHHFIARGEFFNGSNLIPFQGGIDQGAAVQAAPVATAPPLAIQAIHSKGGWAEATILPDSRGRNAVYLGLGTDQPKVSTLLPGSTRVENTFYWISYFRKLTDNVTAAVEWSQWHFHTTTFTAGVVGPKGPDNKADVVNVSFAYQF